MLDSKPFKQLILLKIIIWCMDAGGWSHGVAVSHSLIIFADVFFPILICFWVRESKRASVRSTFLCLNECYSRTHTLTRARTYTQQANA